jgi:propionyl-CoA carboxylase alpha chain
MEMNTRLQVEHPVTECRTGLDLVGLQLRLAGGHRLTGPPPASTGHAIEARLYAEDPNRDWQPQLGRLHRFEVPGIAGSFEPLADGLRLDAAVTDGFEIGPHYDPMLAKLICAGPDRAEVAGRLAASLAAAVLHGPPTNRDLLVRVLRHPRFLAGEADTGLLTEPELKQPLADEPAERLSAVAAALASSAVHRAHLPVPKGIPSGWRNVASQPQWSDYRGRHGDYRIGYRWQRSSVIIEGIADDPVELKVLDCGPDQVTLEIDGLRRTFRVARYPGQLYVDSALGPVALIALPRFADPAEQLPAGSLLAPMPGAVVRLGAALGEPVEAGQPLIWIEAMKMEHPVPADRDGLVRELAVAVGAQVAVGDLLAVVEPDAEPDRS